MMQIVLLLVWWGYCAQSLLLAGQPADVLALENVPSFTTLELTYEVYKQWPSLTLHERLPFLVDRFFVRGVRDDFLQVARSNHFIKDGSSSALSESQLVPVADNSEPVIYHSELKSTLSEFQAEDQVEKFFQVCDTSEDGEVCWQEYLHCRGYFDKMGNQFGLSEYDYLENVVISDFTSRLSDPNDPLALELIARGEL